VVANYLIVSHYGYVRDTFLVNSVRPLPPRGAAHFGHMAKLLGLSPNNHDEFLFDVWCALAAKLDVTLHTVD